MRLASGSDCALVYITAYTERGFRPRRAWHVPITWLFASFSGDSAGGRLHRACDSSPCGQGISSSSPWAAPGISPQRLDKPWIGLRPGENRANVLKPCVAPAVEPWPVNGPDLTLARHREIMPVLVPGCRSGSPCHSVEPSARDRWVAARGPSVRVPHFSKVPYYFGSHP